MLGRNADSRLYRSYNPLSVLLLLLHRFYRFFVLAEASYPVIFPWYHEKTFLFGKGHQAFIAFAARYFQKKGNLVVPLQMIFFPALGPGAHWKTSVTFMTSRDFAGSSGFLSWTIFFIFSYSAPVVCTVTDPFTWKHFLLSAS